MLGDLLPLLMRWLHIIPAGIVLGGVFFIRVVLPAGLKELDEESRQRVFLRCRRVFKMVMHSCILLLLVSGIFNSIRLFPQYQGLQALWGGHVALGAIAIAISLFVLMGKTPPAGHKALVALNIVLLLALMALASAVKQAREARQTGSGSTQSSRQ